MINLMIVQQISTQYKSLTVDFVNFSKCPAIILIFGVGMTKSKFMLTGLSVGQEVEWCIQYKI